MGGGGAGLYASGQGKASVTMMVPTMKVVRRNIALQDFTDRKSLWRKGVT
jgi:hypothetical protein